MNALKRKWNNSDGVTILIALVGFMVAAMISIVIVTAAVTAAERVANDREMTQAHLTLESAAKLVEEEIQSVGYTKTVRTPKLSDEEMAKAGYTKATIADQLSDDKSYGTGYSVCEVGTNSETKEESDPSGASGAGSDADFFGNLLLKAAKTVESTSNDETGSFTISMTDMDDVKVEYKMYAVTGNASGTGTVLDKYDLKLTLTIDSDVNTTLYVLMQRTLLSSTSRNEDAWVDDTDSEGNVTGLKYVLYYTEKKETYGWKVISIQAVDTTDS